MPWQLHITWTNAPEAWSNLFSLRSDLNLTQACLCGLCIWWKSILERNSSTAVLLCCLCETSRTKQRGFGSVWVSCSKTGSWEIVCLQAVCMLLYASPHICISMYTELHTWMCATNTCLPAVHCALEDAALNQGEQRIIGKLSLYN